MGMLSASPLSAQVVAGWDTFTGTGAGGVAVDAPVLATGVTASFVTTTDDQAWNTVDERGASNDGTWGTSVGPPAADTTVGTADDQNLELPNASTGGAIIITLANNSGADIELEAFHFDSYAFRPKAPRAYEITVSPNGAISNGDPLVVSTIYTSGDDEITQVGGANSNNAHDQIDHDLSFLADSTLEDGGTVEFILTFSSGVGDGSGGHDLWVDNLAITSSAAGADQLAVSLAPASATAGTDFSVTIEAQNSGGAPLAGGVTQDTDILLTASGTGVLSNNTATIPMGSNSVTITDLQYTVAEDITLVASQVTGDLLVPSIDSTIITINAGPPTVLTAETSNDGLGTAIENTNFRINDPADTLEVFAISRDSVGNFIQHETTATLTLDNITGSILATDLVDNADGSALFTAQNLGTANVRIAVSGLTDGVSNLITVEEPQFRFTTSGNGSWGVATHWLDDILPPFDNTTDLYFSDEFSTNRQAFLGANRIVRSLNFNELLQPSAIINTFGVRYTQTAGDNPRTLTIDTDAVGAPAEINVAAGNLINIDLGNVNPGFRADTSENYGDTILADPLLITHLGSGNLTFSRPITEVGGSMGVTIDATSTGTVVYGGENTYTGDTTVNGGTLRLNDAEGNSIADTSTLVIDGGMVDVLVDERVAGLTLGGVAQEDGTYGSTASLATIQNDTYFSGPGIITVGPPPAPEVIDITSIEVTGENEVTLNFTGDGLFDIYRSTRADGFTWQAYALDVPAGEWVDNQAFTDGENTFEKVFYVIVTALAAPPANSP